MRHALDELFGLTQRNGFVKRSSRRFHLPSLRGRPSPWLAACDDGDPAPLTGSEYYLSQCACRSNGTPNKATW
jgi:hypothetical protein